MATWVKDILWACRFFILEHDLKILLGEKEPDEETLFPEEFLECLMPEEDVLSSDSPSLPTFDRSPESPIEILLPVSTSPSEQESPSFSSESKSPEPMMPPAVQRQKEHSTIRSPSSSRPSSASVLSSDSLDQILFSRKERKIGQVLRALGMEPIRTKGSHQIWAGSGLQTVVPRHGELATGTLHAIHAQLREQLEKKTD